MFQDLVQYTPSKAQTCLSSSKGLPRPEGSGEVEGFDGETHSSSSINRVPEEDLAQVPLDLRIGKVRGKTEISNVLPSSRSERSNGEFDENRITRTAS